MGLQEAVPPSWRKEAASTFDLAGAWVTPGLIDCHTHLVFAGTRAPEYAERLRGVSYEEIARRGGGILTSVRATRVASEEELFNESAPRLEALLGEGVTTVEVKSGYGLTLADEAKMLRVARRLARDFPVRIRTTLLAAHALPLEYQGRADDYIDAIAREWLPQLHAQGLVDALDVFCDRIGFDVAQSERLFRAARELGVPVKCTRSSSLASAARSSRRAMQPSPVTISSARPPPMRRHWREAAPWPCFCRSPSTAWQRPGCPRSRSFALPGRPWPWRPTATPGPHPRPPCCWRSTCPRGSSA